MNQLEAALAARAFRDGRAKRIAVFRHRRLLDEPLAVVAWQLGAEPFSAAALGFGSRRADLEFVVAGQPLNRDLAFGALLRFARWFNPSFEVPATDRTFVRRGTQTITRARTAPQLLVANEATVEMLGRIGRRLAYLPTIGEHPAAPELVQLGRHLLFLNRHALVPGQQLVVCLTKLMGSHWVTSQSPMERLSLPALDAFIDPPHGVHGFFAAASRERDVAGPAPASEDDQRLEPLLQEFDRRRAKRTDPTVVGPLLSDIEGHYRPLVERTWELLWRCRDREATWPEAPSVPRRWDADCQDYTNHIDWTLRDGRRRTRQTPRQAAMLLRNLEEAKRLLEAEEACDDPFRMVRYLIENKAVQGRVVRVDDTHQEMVRVRRERRPLVTISSVEPCLMPRGKELWWTEARDGRCYLVHDVRGGDQGGSIVTLMLTTSANVPLPKVGDEVCFSIHTTSTQWMPKLPSIAPWTHVPQTATAEPTPIEGEAA